MSLVERELEFKNEILKNIKGLAMLSLIISVVCFAILIWNNFQLPEGEIADVKTPFVVFITYILPMSYIVKQCNKEFMVDSVE